MKSNMRQKVLTSVCLALKETDIALEKTPVSSEKHAVDLKLRSPNETESMFVAYNPALAPYQVQAVMAHLVEQAGPRRYVGLCVRRLSWALVEACKEAHIAVFDEEGNVYVRLPGLYIERVRPGRKEDVQSTSGTVFTAKATRLARAFLKKYPGGWTRGDLVRETELSLGYVSILVKRLLGQVTIRLTEDGGLLIHVPMLARRRGGRRLIIAPEGLDGAYTDDRPANQERLVSILARAHAWDEQRQALGFT